LGEFLRFFGEFALPPELANAARFESWLLRREGKRILLEVNPAVVS